MNDIYKKYRIYGPKKFISYAIIDLKRKLVNQYLLGSYSQSKEDLIIDKILKYKKKGFYVDVGAYDPHRFSNTKKFYLRGWRGINIEPNPHNFKKFIDIRKYDINLNIGIANSNTIMTFYQFIPDTLSTLSSKEAKEYINQGYELVSTKKIKVYKLSDIFRKYCKNKKIDFLSIDTEGFDLQVLKSNNWHQYSPQVICIESTKHSSKLGKRKKIWGVNQFLLKKKYKKIYENKINSIYILKK